MASTPVVITPEKEKAKFESETSPSPSTSASTGSKEVDGPSPSNLSSIFEAEGVRRNLVFDNESLEEGTLASSSQGALAAVLLDTSEEASEVSTPSEGRVYWEAFFVVLPLFSGYAALFGLQHSIKTAFGLKDDKSSASHDFGVAVSVLYMFNLVFRFAHNIFFGCMSPRARVYVSMTAMMLSMLVIAVCIMILESHRLCWVVLAYSLGGVAVGSFESNLLACLTPFGHRTKHIAILGIPVGVTTVLVGGFFLMGPPFELPATLVYLGVAVGLLLGMLVGSVHSSHRE